MLDLGLAQNETKKFWFLETFKKNSNFDDEIRIYGSNSIYLKVLGKWVSRWWRREERNGDVWESIVFGFQMRSKNGNFFLDLGLGQIETQKFTGDESQGW